MKLKNAGLFCFILITLAALLHAIDYWATGISPLILQASRFLAVFGLILLALSKRTLTTWILVAMVLGAEIGHDFPAFAINLQVLSKVFLKMIKTIVAPLLFGTLVYGIAGHSDLKQVGRMGWKSLLYFELVTTVALFIGLAAINLSKA
ncbi:MAG: cation:dicarboxylase symporter family transporter, partial [Mucilaginibacter polytrichastri]|nr:cation:dicarboxylase symporter family transporter [Mucilaginibacter polytrichastri]